MSWALVAVGVVLLSMPSRSTLVRGWLRFDELPRLNAHALGFGLLVLELGLVLLAAPSVLDVVGAGTVSASVNDLDAHVAPGGPIVGWIAAGLATRVGLKAVFSAVRIAVVRRRVGNTIRSGQPTRVIGGHEVVVGSSNELIAFSLTGRGGRIFVTKGLVDALDPEEIAAVVNHEAAHIRHHHGHYLAVAAIVDSCLGRSVRKSTDELRESLERWADERASAAGPAARSSLRAALGAYLVSATETRHPTGKVGVRIEALCREPVRPALSPRLLAYSPVLILTLIGAGLTTDGLGHATVLAVAHLS